MSQHPIVVRSRRAIRRQDSPDVSNPTPSATRVRPMNQRGLTSTPVKGNCFGAAATGTVAGDAAGVGDAAVAGGGAGAGGGGAWGPCATGGGGGGVVVGGGAGMVVVVAGGSVVVVVVGGGLQSSMVCWNPRLASQGGPPM